MDNMKMAIEVVKAHFVSQIIQYIREISNKINKVASEYTHGPMAENIKENGKMTNFMVWEFILRNKNFIVDNSKIINNQALEYYNKKELKYKVTGNPENCMDWFLNKKVKMKFILEFGKMVSNLNGLARQ